MRRQTQERHLSLPLGSPARWPLRSGVGAGVWSSFADRTEGDPGSSVGGAGGDWEGENFPGRRERCYCFEQLGPPPPRSQ